MTAFAWDDVRVFLAVARGGSIAAAAKPLGLDAATVSRRLAAFERKMATSLVTRGRSGVALTPDGASLLAIAARAEEPMLAIERRRGASAVGAVRLATSGILAAHLIAEHVPGFQRSHPEAPLEISVGRRLVDLTKREADVALRLRPPGRRIAEPSTVIVRIADVGFALFGTRAEARARRPRYVRYLGFEPGAARVAAEPAADAPSLRVDEIPTALALARAGCGLAVLPCFMGDREPGLVRASEVVETHKLYVAVLPELRKVPRVAAVVAWLRAIGDAQRAILAGVA